MKTKIIKKEYRYDCDDGCCTEYGVEWYIGDKLIHASPCEDSGWLAVLSHLKIDAQLVGQNKDGEDIWEL